MATYATDLTVLTACDVVTGWSELPNPHASGATPTADTENYFQNGASVSQATGQAANDGAGIQFDNGADISWTTSSNWVFMYWSYYGAPTNLKTWALGGARLGIGSADNNAKFYNAMGNNFGKYPYGGWQNTAIDPEFATADFTLGTPGAGYRNFAFLSNVTTKITKGSPNVVDIIRYGRGEFQVSGTGANFDGMAISNDDPITGRWGLLQKEGGSNFSQKGLMSLGLTGTAVTFTDSNKTINTEDTPRILAGFNKIEVNHVDSIITWDSINLASPTLSITGSAPVSPGDFEVVDNATIDFTSCVFTDKGTFIFNGGTNPNDIKKGIFRRCKNVAQNGATFTDTTFDAPNVAVSTAALSSDDLDIVTGCPFTSAGTGHAVELTDLGDGSITWDNPLLGYDAGVSGSPVTPTNTGDEAIWVNVASGTVTLTVSPDATVPSIRSAGAIVNVVTGTVTVKAIITDLSTGLPLAGVRIHVTKDVGGAIVLEGVTDSNGIVQDTTYSYTVDEDISGKGRFNQANVYKTGNLSGTITSTGLTMTQSLIADE